MNSANVLSNIEEIKIVKFDSTDVQRHPLVSKIIEAYKKKFFRCLKQIFLLIRIAG